MFARTLLFLPFVCGLFTKHDHTQVTKPTNIAEFKDEIKEKELAVVMYGAVKCQHSNHLEHVINELSLHYNSTTATFVSLDCSKEGLTAYCREQHIRKLPTLKFIYLGVYLKTEYRGERRLAAIKEFIDELIDHDIPILEDIAALEKIRIDQNHRCVMGFFKSTDSPEYRNFKKVSGVFHKQCYFYAFINEVQQVPLIAVRDFALGDEVYVGKLDVVPIHSWIRDNCRPLVTEMTFENAEEIVEPNLPLLILYRNGTDKEVVNRFTQAVNTEIRDLLYREILAVHVDGNMFKHALRIAKKTAESMPVIQIDTFKFFKTMDSFEDLNQTGSLRKFVQKSLEKSQEIDEAANRNSIFQRLKPSKSRYSFSFTGHDEL